VSNAVRIGIIGDFNTEFPSHHATTNSLQHAARKLNFTVESEWIPTSSLTSSASEKTLESFDGLWAAPGSPYKSFDGMLKGIEFARRRNWPFLGTCGGFQYALIEFARNVLGIADADSAENNSGSKNIVIYPVSCAVPDRKGKAPKLSGAVPEIRLRPGSYLQSFYGKDKEVVT
jgi:CTP synthase (UTP-ammonia lyase)